ncbi:YfhO family protein [Lentilactobacillus otakiensis]|uniref:YfhO family protein n=1 Tax=Lentilactobacillus otakiensis TaxID=481720 RepID=UPI003D16F75C
MLSQRGRHTKRNFYILAVLTPFLLVSALFVVIGIAPFGAHNLLVSDLSTQYLQFFSELKHQLANFSFSSYSFLMSIGDSLVPIYAYYLLSPLNLIILFFGDAQLPIAIDLIIWVKLILCSISMSVFLAKKYENYDLMAIYGGLAYGLCGFVSMYFYDLMWLDALIWLPIMIYGLEKLFYKGKPTLYVISLIAIIITNFYMGYIICIFNVLYIAYLLKKNQPYALPFFQNLKANWAKISWFIWYSLLSAMSAAVILIPTAIAMLATGKKDVLAANFLFKGTFGLSFPVNFGVGGNDFAGRLVHNPSFFTGSLFMIGIIVYFLSELVSKRDKQAAGILIGGIFVGMWFLPLNTIWHMMQQPAGFPFRMVFLFSFAIIMVTYEGYLQGMFAEEKLLIRSAIGLATAIFIGYIFANIERQKLMEFRFDIPQLSVRNIVFAFVVGLIIVTTIAMIGVGKQRRTSKIFLGLILACELCLNFMIATDGAPFGNQKDFERTYAESNKQISTVESRYQSNDGFYRFLIIDEPFRNLFKVPYSGYNDSFLFRNHGISSYSSTLNAHTHHVLGDLGFSSRNIRRIDMLGGTVITNYFFGLKYYDVVGNHGNRLFVRNHASGLGFMANDRIQHLKLRRERVFDNLNHFVQATAGNHHQYVVKPTIVSSAKFVHRDYFEYKIQFWSNTKGPHYLYIPRIRLVGVSFYVNGQKLSKLYSGLGTEMIPLGYMQKGQISTVTIHSVKELHHLSADFGGINMAKLKQVEDYQDQHKFKLHDPSRLNQHGAHFKGKVDVGSRAKTLVMTIPFEKGWQVKVDGHQQVVKRVAGGLVGIQLTPGKHQIDFNYHIKGLLAGLLITLMGLIGLGGTMVWRRFRAKL